MVKITYVTLFLARKILSLGLPYVRVRTYERRLLVALIC